jgi:predicted RNase H-like HicB family nuclease
MKYTISIETNDDGWLTGQCEQLPQAISQGENLKDLMENMQDAIELVLDYQRDRYRKLHQSNCLVETLTI